MRHARTVAAVSTNAGADAQQVVSGPAERLRQVADVMRWQAWGAFAGALLCVVIFFWTIRYDTGDHSLIGVVLFFAAWVALLGTGLLALSKAVAAGSVTARILTIGVELVVLVTTAVMWWFLPLIAGSVAYVVVTLARTWRAALDDADSAPP